MQFGVFSVSDITRDPVNGTMPTYAERIDAIQAIARTTEEVGLDVFAIGEQHNPPFFSSSPTTLLAAIAMQTRRIALSTSTTVITINDPVRIAEHYAMLQHICHGRNDLMLGRGNTGTVLPWFGRDTDQATDLVVENYHLLHRLWREEEIEWEGRFRAPLIDFTSTPRPLDDVPPFVWHGSVRSLVMADQAASYGDGLIVNNLFAPMDQFVDIVRAYRERFEQYGRGRGDQAIVGIGGQVFISRRSQDAFDRFRPYFNASPVYDHSMTLEEYAARTPIAIGSPQQVIEKILTYQEAYGDYQRQLFLLDHSGLPLATVFEQLVWLGTDVVPVVRAELESRRAPGVPSDPPSHADLVRAKYGDALPYQPRPEEHRRDRVTGTTPYDKDDPDPYELRRPDQT